MKQYKASELAVWHKREQDTPYVERAEIGGFTFNYYLEDFEGVDCDNLVSVLPAEDPTEGVEPIIKVSTKLPEKFRAAFALHEYIEFHAACLDPQLPRDCWEIERYVMAQFSDARDVDEYIQRRLDMFQFIEVNGGLSDSMSITVELLQDYQYLREVVSSQRRKARLLYEASRRATSDAMEVETILSGQVYIPRTVLDEQERIQQEQHAAAVVREARDQAMALLLQQVSDPPADFRDRKNLMEQITTLNGGEYPNFHQRELLLALYKGMHHVDDHQDADPDTLV